MTRSILTSLQTVIGCVAFCLLWDAPAVGEPGQPAAEENQEREEFEDYADVDLESLLGSVSSVAKHQQDILDSPSAITVINREEIENSPCSSVSCLLRIVPEMEVKQIKPMYSIIGARAMNIDPGERVLLLIDGREQNIEFFGPALWESLPVHLQEIERIEVIRGPGSALYGANAHSAIVSITTRKLNHDNAEVFIGVGEQQSRNLSLSMGKTINVWRLHLSGGRETNNSWEVPGKQERVINRVRLHLERESSASVSNLELGLTTTDGLISLGVAPLGLNDSILAHLAASHRYDFLQARLTFSMFDFDADLQLPLVFGDTKLGEIPQDFNVLSTTLDAEVQTNWKLFPGNLLIVGGNYRWITYISSHNLPDETHQHRLGFFVHDEQRLAQKLTLTADVRFDYNNITPFAISPRVAAVLRLSDNQSLRLSFGQAFHKPTFVNTSLHLTNIQGDQSVREFFERSLGNKDLVNERITVLETGYLGHFFDKHLVVEGDLFFNLYRDTINSVVDIKYNSLGTPDLSRSVVQFQNNGLDADTVGGSLALTYRVLSEYYVSANYTYRYSWYPSVPYDRANMGLEKKGDRVSWEPAHLFNLTGYYLAKHGWRMGAGLHAVSSWINVISAGLFGSYQKIQMPGNLFFSVFASWRLALKNGWVEAGVRAIDVFNHGYQDELGMAFPDEKSYGGEKFGRQAMLFFRGAL